MACQRSENDHLWGKKIVFLSVFCFLLVRLYPQVPKLLVNQVGYEPSGPKNAVLLVTHALSTKPTYAVIDDSTGKSVMKGQMVFQGGVDHWKNWIFYTMDFSRLNRSGLFHMETQVDGKTVRSYPFQVKRGVMAVETLSDVVYYFKGQRSTGLFDKADQHLVLAGLPHSDTIDAHGGWYDATGDYGKHLSHLSFSSYYNPQQISLTVWTLFKTFERLRQAPGNDFRQVNRRVFDEAIYGADYLVRLKAPEGSFYRSVQAPGPGKLATDRVFRPETSTYWIKKTKDQAAPADKDIPDWRSFQCSFRSGAGLSIAALAMASTFDSCGDFSNQKYLEAAESAFAFLEAHNVEMTNDGKENLLDDYCALTAATELYKATHQTHYREYAQVRVASILKRLHSWKNHHNYWSVNADGFPFFHASDAGMPVISLLYYWPLATDGEKKEILGAVRLSLDHEISISREVNNPFGYSRQLVDDTLGNRRSAFFFPHLSAAAPWWQGENARLASMASAARMALPFFAGEKSFHDSLAVFAQNQLNWIVGLNPYNVCMLDGKGYNNPNYTFFGTYEYSNAPGGIVNGITSGFQDEKGIDFDLPIAQTVTDDGWRWCEQWLPHAAWFMMAVAWGEL